jgi:hypothetical protein
VPTDPAYIREFKAFVRGDLGSADLPTIETEIYAPMTARGPSCLGRWRRTPRRYSEARPELDFRHFWKISRYINKLAKVSHFA